MMLYVRVDIRRSNENSVTVVVSQYAFQPPLLPRQNHSIVKYDFFVVVLILFDVVRRQYFYIVIVIYGTGARVAFTGSLIRPQ